MFMLKLWLSQSLKSCPFPPTYFPLYSSVLFPTPFNLRIPHFIHTRYFPLYSPCLFLIPFILLIPLSIYPAYFLFILFTFLSIQPCFPPIPFSLLLISRWGFRGDSYHHWLALLCFAALNRACAISPAALRVLKWEWTWWSRENHFSVNYCGLVCLRDRRVVCVRAWVGWSFMPVE